MPDFDDIPYPSPSAAPDGPGAFLANAQAISGRLQTLESSHVATVPELPISGNWPGRQVWVESDSGYYVWTGVEWKPRGLRHVASGTFVVPGAGTLVNPGVSFSTSVAIVFPAGLFTAAPVVAASYRGTGVGWVAQSISATVSGVSLAACRINALPAGSVDWIAVQN